MCSICARNSVSYYKGGSRAALDQYSARALRRVWQVVRFSWWMTSLLHRFPGENAFFGRIRGSELQYLFQSEASQKALAENYVGLSL